VRKTNISYLLGMAHAVQGDQEKARACFEQTLALQAGHLWAALERELVDCGERGQG